MAIIAVICIPLMLLVKPIYNKLTEEKHHVKISQASNYKKFYDEEEDEESPKKLERDHEDEIIQRNEGGSELRMRNKKEADEISDVPIKGSKSGSSEGLVLEDQMGSLLHKALGQKE